MLAGQRICGDGKRKKKSKKPTTATKTKQRKCRIDKLNVLENKYSSKITGEPRKETMEFVPKKTKQKSQKAADEYIGS